MKRLIAALVVASLAVVPASAAAKSKAKVYTGSFTLAGADGNYVTGKFGTVQLVDGKRNDKLSVHVRRLAARTKYTYKLAQGSCGGTAVPGWKYRSLKTSRKGVGNATGRSRTFTASKGVKYFVAVYNAAGDQLVLCAPLRTKAKKPHGKPHKPAKPAKPGKRDDAPRGKGRD
jgi:hypothetical protein